MAQTFQLEIATPDRLLAREQVTEAQIPALNGYLGILPGHSPLLAALGTGELTFKVDGHTRSLAVDGGFVEVQPSIVRILADLADKPDEIDITKVEEELKRAQAALRDPRELRADIATALNAMKRAQARLAAARKT